MLRSQVFPYHRKYVEDLEECYEIIKEQPIESNFEELCKLRGYLQGTEQYALMEELNFCMYSLPDVTILGERRKELGLVTEEDFFLLSGRFILPVKSAGKSLLTLIGYYPDYRKYITLPTMCFSKEVLFFNIDDALRRSWSQFNGIVFLVEGIFDALSLRAIGLPAIATQGNSVNHVKAELLKVFRKVVYIPDNDATGKRALNRHDSEKGWKVPFNAVGIQLKGSYTQDDLVVPIKDIDRAITLFDAKSLKECLLSFAESGNEFEVLNF